MANREDEDAMQIIRMIYGSIDKAVATARSHMQPGGRPEIVNSLFELIEHYARDGRRYAWPDPQARALEDARKDKGVQKLIKKASRKTPI